MRAIAVATLCVLLLGRAEAKPDKAVFTDTAMGTVVSVFFWTDDEPKARTAADAVFTEMKRLDGVMTTQYIPGTDFQHNAIGSAQHQACVPAGHPKHFMAFGVVVVIVIYPITPLRRPAVGTEGLLEQGSWIVAMDSDGLRVDQHRQTRVVRHPAIAFEHQFLCGSMRL